eukprot:8678524-Karenia_brevis.AAC.1
MHLIASISPGSSRSNTVDALAGSTKAAPPEYGGGNGSSHHLKRRQYQGTGSKNWYCGGVWN